jgi:hypothetical protein
MFSTFKKPISIMIAAATLFTSIALSAETVKANPTEGLILTKHTYDHGGTSYDSIQYYNGVFYLTGDNRIYSDDGGNSWKPLSGNNSHMDTAGDGTGKFLSVTGSSSYLIWDANTREQTTYNKDIPHAWPYPLINSLTYFKGAYYGAGYDKPSLTRFARIFKLNPDGESWQHITVQGTPLELTGFQKIRSNDEVAVAVGEGGLISTSRDGSTWIQRESGTYQNLSDVTAAVYGKPMVAVGKYNTITISEDNGETWEAYGFNYSMPDLTSITYARGYYVISSEYGSILLSQDGRNWTEFDHGFGRIGINSINMDRPGQMVITGGMGLVISVSKSDTSTTLESNRNSSAQGQSVTFTATVTKPSNSSITERPAGTVTFKDGDTVLGTAPIGTDVYTLGKAVLTVDSLSLGDHQITALYSGADKFNASTSAPLAHTVKAAAPEKNAVTMLRSSLNPSPEGETVTFTANIYGLEETPIGNVTFKNGDTVLGIAPLTVGSATYSVTELRAGTYPITVIYSGDYIYKPGTSPVLHQVVTGTDTTSPTPPPGAGGNDDDDTAGDTGGGSGDEDFPVAEPAPDPAPEYQDPNDIFRSRVVQADSNVIVGVEKRTAEILSKPNAWDTLQYDDVAQHWSSPSIVKLTQLGVLNGYPDGGFEPDEQITRAEFAAMIARGFVDMAGRIVNYKPEDFTEFKDINDHWSSEYLMKLVSVGVMTGYEDGTIRPEKTISRQEMALIITRVLNAYILNRDTSHVQFTDLSHAYGADAIKKATSLGIFTGKTNQTFDPDGGATRAESIQAIINTYSLSPAIKEALNLLN